MLIYLLLTLTPIADFERPQSEFGSGHRGVDLRLTNITSPVDGEVSFVGKVFTRELITIQGTNGKYSFEPVCSELELGESVAQGQTIGIKCETESYSPHCEGCVHVSFRDPDYLNPLWVLGLREPSKAVSGSRMGLRITLSEPFD